MSDLVKEQGASRSNDCPPCPGKPVLERIDARQAEISKGFIVRRAVPSRGRRMVGAWCFLDHAGPVQHGPGEGLQVGPHPHIGLQTFTWMIEGEAVAITCDDEAQLLLVGAILVTDRLCVCDAGVCWPPC